MPPSAGPLAIDFNKLQNLVTNHYPKPIALEYDKLIGSQTPREKFEDLRYAAEVSVHLTLVIGLAGYFSAKHLEPRIDKVLYDLFQLGRWGFGHKMSALKALCQLADWQAKAGLAMLAEISVNDLDTLVHQRNLASHYQPSNDAEAGDLVNLLLPLFNKFLYSLESLMRRPLLLPIAHGQVNGKWVVQRVRRLTGLKSPSEEDCMFKLRLEDCTVAPYRMVQDYSPLLAPLDGGECLSLFPFARFVPSGKVLPDLALLDRVRWDGNAEGSTRIKSAGFGVSKLHLMSQAQKTFTTNADSRDMLRTLDALAEYLDLLGRFKPTPERESEAGAGVQLPNVKEGEWPRTAEWKGVRRQHTYTLLEVSRFVGRKADLEWLDRWAGLAGYQPDDIPEEAPVVCLHALGGGGKTAIAWQWAVEAGEDRFSRAGYAGVFWCTFYARGYDFTKFLRGALEFLGVAFPRVASEDERPELERLFLDALSKARYLFVLDGIERKMNAFAAEDAKATDDDDKDEKIEAGQVDVYGRQMVDPDDGRFLLALPARLALVRPKEAQSRVLITSRIPPAAFDDLHRGRVHLREQPGFSQTDALELWKAEGLSHTAEMNLESMFMAWGYHPLVIALLAKEVRESAARGNFNDWRQRNPDFDPYERRAGESGQSKTTLRQRALGVLLRAMDDPGWAVLECIANNPDPSLLTFLAEILVRRLKDFPSEDKLWTKLQELRKRGLIGQGVSPEGPNFDAHPVVRGYVWKRLIDPAVMAARQRRYMEAFAEVLPEYSLAQAPIDGVKPEDLSVFGMLGWCRVMLAERKYEEAWKQYVDKLRPRLMLVQEMKLAEELLLKWFVGADGRPDPAALPRLESRKDQAQAVDWLATHLMIRGGQPEKVDRLMRLAASAYLLGGDQEQALSARTGRMWRVFYEGRLFEAEQELRRLTMDAAGAGLPESAARAALWTGLVIAMRGGSEEFERLIEAVRPAVLRYDRRSALQVIAEGYYYLGQFDQALRELQSLDNRPEGEPLPESGQLSWELLTLGMVYREKGRLEDAYKALTKVVYLSRRRLDRVVEGFALTETAWRLVQEKRPHEAQRVIKELYLGIDPGGAWALGAASAYAAWEEANRCLGTPGLLLPGSNRTPAEQGIARAVCDGEPFVYRLWYDRLVNLLPEATRSATLRSLPNRLPPDWEQQLHPLEEVLAAAKGNVPAGTTGTPLGAIRHITLLSPSPPGWLSLMFSDGGPAPFLPALLSDRLALAETQLGLPAADPEARVWWAGFRQLNADLWVNRVCQQLATERITLPKFVAAVRAADNPDWLSILVHARRGKGQT